MYRTLHQSSNLLHIVRRLSWRVNHIWHNGLKGGRDSNILWRTEKWEQRCQNCVTSFMTNPLQHKDEEFFAFLPIAREIWMPEFFIFFEKILIIIQMSICKVLYTNNYIFLSFKLLLNLFIFHTINLVTIIDGLIKRSQKSFCCFLYSYFQGQKDGILQKI